MRLPWLTLPRMLPAAASSWTRPSAVLVTTLAGMSATEFPFESVSTQSWVVVGVTLRASVVALPSVQVPGSVVLPKAAATAAAKSIPCHGWPSGALACPTAQPLSDHAAKLPLPQKPVLPSLRLKLSMRLPEQPRATAVTERFMASMLAGPAFWMDTHGPNSASLKTRLSVAGAAPAVALTVTGRAVASACSDSASVTVASACNRLGQNRPLTRLAARGDLFPPRGARFQVR
jgi:hypothetical protein